MYLASLILPPLCLTSEDMGAGSGLVRGMGAVWESSWGSLVLKVGRLSKIGF